ncbi:MAG: apolipoprotein N-acyltransferase, partial [Rhizobiaceae bacterium]
LMMQSASLIGIFGVTLLCIPVIAALGVFTPKSSLRARGTTKMLVLALALLLAHFGFGYWRLSLASNEMVADVSLRLVQPAVAQNEKWLPEKEAEIFRRYLTLSTKEISPEKKGLSGITHLIWPESAFPFLLTERKDALAAIGAMLPEGTTLITGAARAESSIAGQASGFVFNSIYTIDAEGVIASAADKVHLVPFGEYLPLQELAESLGLQQLTKIRGGFEPGNIRPLLSAMSGPAFLPLICYEIIFSGEVLPKDSDKKPEWIVNLTNDAWFGMTPGPYQHLQQAIVRGVEEGLPVVRVANTGISAVTDSYGRVLGQIALGEMGVIDTALPKPSSQTIFSRFGHWSFFFLVGLMLLMGVMTRRRAE